MSDRPATTRRGSRGPRPDPAPPRPGALIGSALVGLVLGWLLRPVSIRLSGTAPTVGWLPVLALAFVALVIGLGRLVDVPVRCTAATSGSQPHHAVNRLVLAKACALVGALVAGGYSATR